MTEKLRRHAPPVVRIERHGKDRERISKDIEAYLANGGTITYVPNSMQADRFVRDKDGIPRNVNEDAKLRSRRLQINWSTDNLLGYKNAKTETGNSPRGGNPSPKAGEAKGG